MRYFAVWMEPLAIKAETKEEAAERFIRKRLVVHTDQPILSVTVHEMASSDVLRTSVRLSDLVQKTEQLVIKPMARKEEEA